MPTPENEQKIRYLSRYRKIDRQIDQLLEEQSRWRERALKITPTLSQAPGGGGSGSPIERPMDKVSEIETEINRKIDELKIVQREIEETLNQLEDGHLNTLMKYRYINGLTWERIAEKMDYSRQWVTSLHGMALQKIKLTCC